MRGLRIPPPARTAAAVLALAVAATALAGCTAKGLDDKQGIVISDGTTVVEVPLDKRKDPIEFSGTLDSGASFDSKQELGHVVVVNFWYAQCPPCRLEADALEKVSVEYQPKGVDFVGINTRDSQADSQTFASSFGVTYPSVLDAASGEAQLAFSGTYRPNATPTTIVLDKKGRVAARIEGPIDDQPSTLTTLIDDALAEEG